MEDPNSPPRTSAHDDRGRLRLSDIVPLLGYVIPTVIIGYGFVIPRSPIAGVNEVTIGFGTSILAACATYLLGVRRALRR